MKKILNDDVDFSNYSYVLSFNNEYDLMRHDAFVCLYRLEYEFDILYLINEFHSFIFDSIREAEEYFKQNDEGIIDGDSISCVTVYLNKKKAMEKYPEYTTGLFDGISIGNLIDGYDFI